MSDSSFAQKPKFKVSRLRRHWPIALILFAATGFRFISLSSHSLLIDEAFTALSARDIAYNNTPIWDATSNALHSKLVAMLFTGLGSDAEWVCRLPSALAGVIVVWLIYLLSQRWCVRPIAIGVAALAAFHPFLIAFSRVCFADMIQTAVILGAILSMETLTAASRTPLRKEWPTWLLLAGLLAAAFHLKFNAPFFIGLWVVSAALTRLYNRRQVLLFLGLQLLVIVLALAFSPYGLLPWFVSFVSHAGSQNLPALEFFQLHLTNIDFHLSAFVAVMTIIAVMRKWDGSIRTFQVFLFVLLSLIGLVLLGRTFQRYLLAIAPMICYLLVVSFYNGLLYFRRLRSPKRWPRRALSVAGALLLWVAIQQFGSESFQYVHYLRNDVNFSQVAADVTAELGSGRRINWMLPETIGAYYLGFDRYYSRALPHRSTPQERLADNLYFEGSPIPYGAPLKPYRTLLARQQLQRWGLWKSIVNRGRFLDSLGAAIARSKQPEIAPAQPVDLLVVVGGLLSSGGEPVLIPYDPRYYPMLPRSPDTAGFRILKQYKPRHLVRKIDEVNVWLLEKK